MVFVRPGGGSAAIGAASPAPSATTADATGAAPVTEAMAGETPAAARSTAAAKRGKKSHDTDETASGPSKHTDTKAVTYFKERWSGDKAVKRITDIRTVGKYLRIYTDLPETAHNSKSAIDLCKRGLEYLSDEVGDDNPVVFVQAQYGQNGNPVLANVLGPGDKSCRLTSPPTK